MTRIVIAGGPRTGKSTLAGNLFHELPDSPVRHTDDTLTMGLDWSAGSQEVATWFDEDGPWVIEGVATPRALRKWLAAHDGKPCDVAVWLAVPFEELTPGQASMTKGCEKVWDEIEMELRDRGVVLCYSADELRDALKESAAA